MKTFLHYLISADVVAVLLGATLTSIFGLLAAFSKEKRIPKCIAWGIFFAGLIVLLGGILSGYEGKVASELLQRQTEEIAKLALENADLAKRNANLNKKISNTITGGNSYCYFLIGKPSKFNTSDLLLITKGEYPIYDVQIKITDVDKRMEHLQNEFQRGNAPYDSIFETYKQLNKSSRIINLGNVGPNQGFPLGTLTLPEDADKKTYHIEIYARNGRVLQFVQFRRVKGEWKRAEKTFFNGEVVGKSIPSDFPRDDDSKFIWKD